MGRMLCIADRWPAPNCASICSTVFEKRAHRALGHPVFGVGILRAQPAGLMSQTMAVAGVSPRL